MTITRFAALMALVLAVPLTALSALDFNQDLTISIPELDGDLTALDLQDVNFDGHPEILALGATTLVCYDYANDTVLFSQALPLEWNIAKVLLADVNNDSIADFVVAGVIEDTPEFIVAAFNGATEFNELDSIRHHYDVSFIYDLGAAIRELESADYDFDGQNEMLVSFDSVEINGGSPGSGSTKGLTYIYDSFPGDLYWQLNFLFEQVLPAATSTVDSLLIAVSHNNSYSETGPDYYRTVSQPVVLNIPGYLFSTAGSDEPASPCADGSLERTETILETPSWCVGDIDLGSTGSEIASVSRVVKNCALATDTGVEHRTVSANYLSLHHINSDGVAELVWSYEVGPLYDNLLFYPGHDGFFFALDSNIILQISGLAAIILQQSAPLPAGTKYWDYPFPDSIPRLVNYAGDSITFFSIDPATHVGNDPEPALPSHFTLGIPYPNPFNPSTTIPFALPKRSHVRIEAFNLLGQLVSVIYEGELGAGNQSVSWNASGAPSGVYLLRVATDCGERSAKVMLLK